MCPDPQNSACFSKTIDLRGHMPRFTPKMNVFPSISIETPKMCVETLRTVLISPRRSIWEVICLGLVEKCMFSQLCSVFFFPETVDLRGHMPRFTPKMNVFQSISIEQKMCVETLRTVLISPSMIKLRGHMPSCSYLKNECFPSICVFGIYLSYRHIDIAGVSMPRFTSNNMTIFQSISMGTDNVLTLVQYDNGRWVGGVNRLS